MGGIGRGPGKAPWELLRAAFGPRHPLLSANTALTCPDCPDYGARVPNWKGERLAQKTSPLKICLSCFRWLSVACVSPAGPPAVTYGNTLVKAHPEDRVHQTFFYFCL